MINQRTAWDTTVYSDINGPGLMPKAIHKAAAMSWFLGEISDNWAEEKRGKKDGWRGREGNTLLLKSTSGAIPWGSGDIIIKHRYRGPRIPTYGGLKSTLLAKKRHWAWWRTPLQWSGLSHYGQEVARRRPLNMVGLTMNIHTPRNSLKKCPSSLTMFCKIWRSPRPHSPAPTYAAPFNLEKHSICSPCSLPCFSLSWNHSNPSFIMVLTPTCHGNSCQA